jgi:hypothetical protein
VCKCIFSEVRLAASKWLFSAVFQLLCATPYRKFESHSASYPAKLLRELDFAAHNFERKSPFFGLIWHPGEA